MRRAALAARLALGAAAAVAGGATQNIVPRGRRTLT